MKKIELVDKADTMVDLKIRTAGYRSIAEKDFSFGPLIRDHYVLIFIIKGTARLITKYGSFDLHEDEGFLIYPDEVHSHQTLNQHPLDYYFITFHGLRAQSYLEKTNLTPQQPIFSYKKIESINSFIKNLTHRAPFDLPVEMRLLSYLYLHLSQLIETSMKPTSGDKETRREKYIKKALSYMDINYAQKISIAEVANFVGLDVTYLGKLFRQSISITPYQYLCQLRVKKACEYLSRNDITISEISRSVGYDDPLHFSKVFKRIKHISPSHYRREYPL